MTRIVIGVLSCFLGGYAAMQPGTAPSAPTKADAPLPLGNFSVSLTVKDVAASRAFYEKLGFHVFGNTASKNMVILQNDTCTIGLFHGMFEKNSLTFNPGWDRDAKTLSAFMDVREIQKTLKARGLVPTPAADETGTGPTFLVLTDPDGNPVIIDQHVPSPKK